jgi:hypothetical protein
LKDFDTDRIYAPEEERTFRVAGETFLVKTRLAPELVMAVFGVVNQEWLDACDRMMEAALEGENAVARWKRLRDPKNPQVLSIREINTVTDFVIEVTSGRPTVSSSGSSSSAGSAGTSSTDTSPLEAAS